MSGFALEQIAIPATLDAPDAGPFVEAITVAGAVFADAFGTPDLDFDPAEELPQYQNPFEPRRLFAARIEGIALVLPHQAGEEGKLFGSVTNMELAEQLKKQGIEIDRKKIALAEPIKQLGEYTVGVKVHPEVVANLKVNVTKAE